MLDQTTITFAREDAQVTARIDGPRLPAPRTSAPTSRRYEEITTALRGRGLPCGVEYGMSDYYVWAELPDGGNLIVSPLQEPAEPHPPRAWLATAETDSVPYEVWWDSTPGAPESAHQGSVPHLLAALDRRLDDLGVPPRKDTRPVLNEAEASSVLHRAGFVPVVLGADRFHRLPLAMTDNDELRQTVTQAVDGLMVEGFSVRCQPDLLSPEALPVRQSGPDLGDLLALLPAAMREAEHTREAVAVLSAVTAPHDGVLEQVGETLRATADFWEGLGGSVDPHYANRLRYITEQLDAYALELRSMRGDLADRHAVHPDRARLGRAAPREPNAPRVTAALAPSPTARRTPAAPPATPATPAPSAAARPSSTRRR